MKFRNEADFYEAQADVICADCKHYGNKVNDPEGSSVFGTCLAGHGTGPARRITFWCDTCSHWEAKPDA